MITDHRAILSIPKDRCTKSHQSRLARWTDRLLPFTFKMEHLAGSKMGFVDYISRNPCNQAKPISKYDEVFKVAQIETIWRTLYIINSTQKRKRGRPRKYNGTANTDFQSSNQCGRPKKYVSNIKAHTSTKQQSSNNYNYNLQSGNECIKATKQSKEQLSNKGTKQKNYIPRTNATKQHNR